MHSTTLEINEKEYCIKLNKDSFDLSLIRQLIRRIEAEELFFSKKNAPLEEDIISRTSSKYGDSFDSLYDK